MKFFTSQRFYVNYINGEKNMTDLFEMFMMISFGISWPSSIIKSFTSRTAKGKSIVFLVFILLGYLLGMAAKFSVGKLTYVFVFYVINFIMVSVDMILYFRNRKLDKIRDQEIK